MRADPRVKRAPGPNFAERIELRFARSVLVDGLWVGGLEDKATLDRVETALRLIKTHHPLNYRRVLRELERVWVHVLTASQGLYRASIRACELDTRYVQRASAERIASTIVHEATHAKLARCGVVYDEPLRVRIEGVCIRRQLAFTAKLPEGDKAHQEAQTSLAGLSRETYTDQAFRARDDRGSVEALRYLGMPEWFIRAMFRLRGGMIAVHRWFRRPAR